jgi:hypothetical protein
MPVWVGGEKARGYKLEQFSDAFDRVVGGRDGWDGRSDSSTEAAPTTPTAEEREEESGPSLREPAA